MKIDPNSEAECALVLAEGSPIKDKDWMERASLMCKHCREHEDVYMAAARILAEQARFYHAEYESWRKSYARDCNAESRRTDEGGSAQ